jgi:hypothetical protein
VEKEEEEEEEEEKEDFFLTNPMPSSKIFDDFPFES